MFRSTLYVATEGSLKRLRTSLAASPRSSRSPSRISVWASPAEMRRPATASSRICWTGRPEGCRSIAGLLYRILGGIGIPTEDPQWSEWSSSMLARCAETGILVINPIIYAEVSVGFQRIEDLDDGRRGTLGSGESHG